MAINKQIANPTYTPQPFREFKSFSEFYPYYLGEHSNKICRRLHLFGTMNLFWILLYAFAKKKYEYIPLGPIQAYFFAWVGHFLFEKNKPATFKMPIYSLMGDFRMLWEVLSLQRQW
ncbi:uncharacterized protein VTP21DRAFT_205 [Calcarisporiella thermophila]|uniref:uncharacterized protein n=1 Tax=Calcarisporiella thermophila TaxID=911321 RepID=UPI0037422078